MGYIYIIKNKVNDKVYIGKTNLSVEKRFKQHIRECKKSRCEKRPLYAAMLKHGTDNFYIECLEETQDTNQREQYWIQYYKSYQSGYNATLGGDGSEYVDKSKIIEQYNRYKTIKDVIANTGHDASTIRRILKGANIEIVWNKDAVRKKKGKHVAQLHPDTQEILNVFLTIKEASRAIMANSKVPIQKALKNEKRKYALGYLWKEITLDEYEKFTRSHSNAGQNSQNYKGIEMAGKK